MQSLLARALPLLILVRAYLHKEKGASLVVLLRIKRKLMHIDCRRLKSCAATTARWGLNENENIANISLHNAILLARCIASYKQTMKVGGQNNTWLPHCNWMPITMCCVHAFNHKTDWAISEVHKTVTISLPFRGQTIVRVVLVVSCIMHIVQNVNYAAHASVISNYSCV